MAESTHPSLEDLAYVRRVAESGDRAPLLGGRFMAWWGLLVAAAYVAQHLALHGAIGDGPSIFGIIWATFSMAGVAGQLVLARTMSAKSGAGSAGNRASFVAWMAAAAAIGSMVIGTAIAAETGGGPAAFDWIVPVAFAVYACALIVTGWLGASRVCLTAGTGAIVMVGLFTALVLHPDRYVVAAAGAAITVMLPGLLLLRGEPQAQA